MCQKIERIGKTSFDIKSAIFENGNRLAICISTATCVCYDFTKESPVEVYKEIINDYNNN